MSIVLCTLKFACLHQPDPGFKLEVQFIYPIPPPPNTLFLSSQVKNLNESKSFRKKRVKALPLSTTRQNGVIGCILYGLGDDTDRQKQTAKCGASAKVQFVKNESTT